MSWRFIPDEEMPQEITIEREVPKEIFLPIEGHEPLMVEWTIRPLEAVVEVRPDPRYVVVTIPKESTESFYYLSYSIENDSSSGSITLQVQEEGYLLTEKEKKEIEFLGSDNRDMKSGTTLQYRVSVPEKGDIRFTCDKEELMPYLKGTEEGISISPPLECRGIYEISYEVLDGDGEIEAEGQLLLRVQSRRMQESHPTPLESKDSHQEPSSSSLKESDPKESHSLKPKPSTHLETPKSSESIEPTIFSKPSKPTLPPLDGEYEVAVFFKGEEVYEKRVLLEENKSLIIGKQTSKLLSPDIDLRSLLTDMGKRACSRQQLKVLIHQNRAYLCNIGNHPVELGKQILQVKQESLWDPASEVVIAGEVSLQLRRRRE